MSYIVTIIGISGAEGYLTNELGIVSPGVARYKESVVRAKARRFRSVATASTTAQLHIDTWPPVVARQMRFTVEDADREEPPG